VDRKVIIAVGWLLGHNILFCVGVYGTGAYWCRVCIVCVGRLPLGFIMVVRTLMCSLQRSELLYCWVYVSVWCTTCYNACPVSVTD